MSVLDAMVGSWAGIGQRYEAESKNVIGNMHMEITIEKVNDTKIAGVQDIIYMNHPEGNKSNEFTIEIINEFEFAYKPSWSDQEFIFTYMDQPVSFQGSYITDFLGPNTRTLDNNFIVEDQWQINIERECPDTNSHTISEFVLEKED